jgi:NAD(P)-dependent dehydrogenase (short-subunit alcohol dehydrogenase family)
MAETQRVAIVTGAAGGIGRVMTWALLAKGIRVAGVDRDGEPLEALAATAREQGNAVELLTIATDLTDDSAADAITKATRGKFGRVDILVNNAGIGPGAIRPDSRQRPLKFWEITPDQWRLFVAVHATAPLALTNAVVPEMIRQGWGRIVNVTTSLGTMLNAGNPAYGPSKAALEAPSAIMAKDLDGTGVTVNVLVPGGATNTSMISDDAGFDRAKLIQPEVMGPPLVWLVSDAAGNVTGRRFLAVHWDARPPPEEAAEKAGAPVAWTRIATTPIRPGRSQPRLFTLSHRRPHAVGNIAGLSNGRRDDPSSSAHRVEPCDRATTTPCSGWRSDDRARAAAPRQAWSRRE